jgi:hypothetical protein
MAGFEKMSESTTKYTEKRPEWALSTTGSRARWWLLPLVLAQVTLLEPAFQTTDDMYLLGAACGYWTGAPHEALVFSHVGLGLLLKHLYLCWPWPNWYVLLHLAVQLLAVQVLLPPLALRWRSLLYITVFAEAFLWPQYTISAYLCLGAGWHCWIQALRGRAGTGAWAGGLALQVLGNLIRPYCFGSMAVLALPLWLALWWRAGRPWKPLLWPALALLIAGGLQLWEKQWYETHWHDGRFMDYQIALDALANGPNHWEARWQTPGTPPRVSHEAPLPYRMLDEWWLLDKHYLGRNEVIQLAEGQRAWRFGRNTLDYARRMLADEWHIWLLGLGLMYLSGWHLRARRREALLLLGALALQWLLLLGLSRLPHRVLYPQLAVLLCWFWALYPPDMAALRRRILAAAALLLALAGLYKKVQHTRFLETLWQQRQAFMAAHPDQLILYVGGPHNWDGMWSWRNPAPGSTRNSIPLGWLSNTPAGDAVWRYHQLDNLADALLATPDRFILAEPPPGLLEDYFQTYYGVQLHLTPVTADGVYWRIVAIQ